jgi:hypothetical protein
MKKSIYKLQILIWILLCIPIIGFAQGGFSTKKKNPTLVNTAVLNAIRIDGSKNSSKNFQSKKIYSVQPGKLAKFQKSVQKVVLSPETNLPVFIQTIPDTAKIFKSGYYSSLLQLFI